MGKNIFRNWKWGLGCFLSMGLFWLTGLRAEAEEPIVVVLDPGHGGKNLGAEYEEYTEKEMTMVVAKAMKAELEQYEGIEVYLTHEDAGQDMSLEERAEFARNLDADFLFCLHFNMSEEHNKFGAEVWVSAFGDKYQKGYTFASVEMELLERKGLYSRGIKTRLNDDGEDYYGILRHATAKGVPAALIEHCHLDQENDWEFYDSREKLEQFGILDATAAAKYFGLRSKALGVDYSGYKNVEIPEPVVPVKPDTSEPDVCAIEIKDIDGWTGEVTVQVSAADYDSYILYYSYSFDGGETFSDLQRWEPRDADSLTFVMKVPPDILPEAVVNVYNCYDRVTQSNHISLPSMHYEEAVEAGVMSAESSAGNRGEEAGGDWADLDGAAGGYGDGAEKAERKEENAPETGNDAKDSQDARLDSQAGIADNGGRDGGLYAEASMGNHRALSDREQAPEMTIGYFLQVCVVCAAILFALLLIARLAIGPQWGRQASLKKKRRRKK